MGTRRNAREMAVQFLFLREFNEEADREGLLALFWDFVRADEEERSFARALILGVLDVRDELDRLLERYVENWGLKRIAGIERHILRISFYEILYRAVIPDVASINEAVDIAKKYGSAESGKFVNGILDRVKSCETKRYEQPPAPSQEQPQ